MENGKWKNVGLQDTYQNEEKGGSSPHQNLLRCMVCQFQKLQLTSICVTLQKYMFCGDVYYTFKKNTCVASNQGRHKQNNTPQHH
jgi:hypothetical protein